jgi:hypothetical protein
MRPGSCARATGARSNGIAAALPMSVMNSRHLMCLPQTEDHTLASFGARSAVHHSKISCPMSPSGHFRRLKHLAATSAITPNADIPAAPAVKREAEEDWSTPPKLSR